MDRILIIRTSSLGDIIHTLPAFAALRKRYAETRIGWVVEDKGREILDLVSGIDDIIVVGSPEWRTRLRNKSQVAVDFQGLIKSGLVAWLSRSRRRLGFSRPNLKEPAAGLFYTQRLEPVPETAHVILKNMRLLRLLGIDEEEFEFPISIPAGAIERVRSKVGPAAPGRTRVIFNVGAAWPTKRWPSEKWIVLLEALKSDGLDPVLLWGTPEEKISADAVQAATGVAAVPFLTIVETLALIRCVSLVVSGDTFALQAACALDVPVVGLFGPTDPARNGPFRPRDAAAYHEIPCSRCYRRSCPTTDCLARIEPGEVLTLIRGVLNRHA